MVYTHIVDLSAAVQSPDSRTKPAGGARISMDLDDFKGVNDLNPQQRNRRARNDQMNHQ